MTGRIRQKRRFDCDGVSLLSSLSSSAIGLCRNCMLFFTFLFMNRIVVFLGLERYRYANGSPHSDWFTSRRRDVTKPDEKRATAEAPCAVFVPTDKYDRLRAAFQCRSRQYSTRLQKIAPKIFARLHATAVAIYQSENDRPRAARKNNNRTPHQTQSLDVKGSSETNFKVLFRQKMLSALPVDVEHF